MSAKMKVLLVDDEPFVIRAITSMLESEGHDVVSCTEWMQVANIVRTEQPNIVLLDYNMPTLKGDSICTILKRNVSDPDLRIVIFSSEPERDLVRITRECGADGYIRKNVPATEILSQLSAATRDLVV